jgi:hypothetical protein
MAFLAKGRGMDLGAGGGAVVAPDPAAHATALAALIGQGAA